MVVMAVEGFSSAWADTSAIQTYAVAVAAVVEVSPAGGNINTTINEDTGALGAAFTPSFQMRSNDSSHKNLTLKVEANTASGLQNAIFNIGSTKYMIMTSSANPPAVSSLTNIKTGPTQGGNPNAIAYVVNNPSDDTGNITITYQSTYKNWNLYLRTSRNSRTTLRVPASTPMNNTFDYDDESGNYNAIVTLSFNP